MSRLLIRTRKGYAEPGPPPLCPSGHPLGPRQVLVGTHNARPALTQCAGPHRTFTCRACGATIYDPEPTPECTFVAFDGRIVPRGNQ